MEEEKAKPKATKNNTISALQLLAQADEKKEQLKLTKIQGYKQKLVELQEEEEAFARLIEQQNQRKANESDYDNLLNFYQTAVTQTSREVEGLRQQVLLSMNPANKVNKVPDYQNWQSPQIPLPQQEDPSPPVELASRQNKNPVFYYLAIGSLLGILVVMASTFIFSKNNVIPFQKNSYPARVIFK